MSFFLAFIKFTKIKKRYKSGLMHYDIFTSESIVNISSLKFNTTLTNTIHVMMLQALLINALQNKVSTTLIEQ